MLSFLVCQVWPGLAAGSSTTWQSAELPAAHMGSSGGAALVELLSACVSEFGSEFRQNYIRSSSCTAVVTLPFLPPCCTGACTAELPPWRNAAA
jgi:hypothetical protein